MPRVPEIVQEHGGRFPFRGQPGVPVRFPEHPGAIGGTFPEGSLRPENPVGPGILRQTGGGGESLVHGMEIRDFPETVAGFHFHPQLNIIYIIRRLELSIPPKIILMQPSSDTTNSILDNIPILN